jgi:hypothetical protein
MTETIDKTTHSQIAYLWVILFAIGTQLLLLIANLVSDQLSLNNSFTFQNPPDYQQIGAVLPSILIIFIVVLRLAARYKKQKNPVTLLMFLYIIFLWFALLAALMMGMVRGAGKLSVYFDRTVFNLYTVSGYYLYLFMNEVFRSYPVRVKKGEKIFMAICLILPLMVTALRQAIDLPDALESLGLALAGFLILIPNLAIIWNGVKILRVLKVEGNLDHPTRQPLIFVVLSCLIMIIFAVIFVVIILVPALNRSWLYWFDMILVIFMTVCFYRAYLKPKD